MEAGLHQRSALSPLLFTRVMDRLTDGGRQESPWTVMFADDIVKCTVSREQLMENPHRWQNRTLLSERRGAEWNAVVTGSGDKGGKKKVEEISNTESQQSRSTAPEERVPGGWKELTRVSGMMRDKRIKVKESWKAAEI